MVLGKIVSASDLVTVCTDLEKLVHYNWNYSLVLAGGHQGLVEMITVYIYVKRESYVQ